jgi:hypothetical protein
MLRRGVLADAVLGQSLPRDCWDNRLCRYLRDGHTLIPSYLAIFVRIQPICRRVIINYLRFLWPQIRGSQREVFYLG